ncbi:hypothetical protein BN946_scf184996.g21 [Trametes cinnabarina]|uniref:Wax synthase domain-containing protein n=1 Tax=Pycnoporus cinnabarinus TaxID=5643 RepID=A0A060S2Q2_PYCCI|nr:hypothetical protein BN946_scf184996.g21 [Trametes cinnabarina]
MADAASPTSYAAGRPPLPLLTFVILPDVVLACLMALRRPSGIKIGVSLLLLSASAYACIAYTMGNPTDDYTMGSTVFGNMVLNITLFIWLTDPVKDYRYLRDPTPLTEKPLLSRIWYSLCIIHNQRLIGTNAQVANVPPPFRGTRSQFLWKRLQQLLISLAIVDVVCSFVHTHHHLYQPEIAPLYFPSGAFGYLMRTGCTAIWLVMSYLMLKLSYIVLSMSAVATHLGNGNPEDWPDLFGPWSEAYTIRHLWGRAWHQGLRRHFSRWGKLAVEALGIPRGTWLSSQVQVHTAFALSALLHCMGDLMLGKEHFGRSWVFFAANGLVITVEDTVIALANRVGLGSEGKGRPGRGMRILGYIWVYIWFTYSGPLYYSWLFESGVGLTDPLPYSPTRSLIPVLCRST